MRNRSKRLQSIVLNAVLAAGLLTCSVIAANAQAQMSADQQVRSAQEASEKAIKAKPQPTSLVLMNGVLVEEPMASTAPASEEPGLNVPAAGARPVQPAKAVRPVDPQSTAVPAGGVTFEKTGTPYVGPSSADVPEGARASQGVPYVPGEPSSAAVPGSKKP